MTKPDDASQPGVEDHPMPLGIVLKIDAQSRRRALEIAEDKLAKQAEERGLLLKLVKGQATDLGREQREWEALAEIYAMRDAA